MTNRASQGFESEKEITVDRGDEAGEADDPAGIVKVLEEDRAVGAGGIKKQLQGVVCDWVAGRKA